MDFTNYKKTTYSLAPQLRPKLFLESMQMAGQAGKPKMEKRWMKFTERVVMTRRVAFPGTTNHFTRLIYLEAI